MGLVNALAAAPKRGAAGVGHVLPTIALLRKISFHARSVGAKSTFGILSESSKNISHRTSRSFNQRVSDAIHLCFGQAKTDSVRHLVRDLATQSGG